MYFMNYDSSPDTVDGSDLEVTRTKTNTEYTDAVEVRIIALDDDEPGLGRRQRRGWKKHTSSLSRMRVRPKTKIQMQDAMAPGLHRRHRER